MDAHATQPAFLTVRQAAALLQMSPTTIYGHCDSGALEHYRLGEGRCGIRITQKALDAFLESRRNARKIEPIAEPPAERPRMRRSTSAPFEIRHLANYRAKKLLEN